MGAERPIAENVREDGAAQIAKCEVRNAIEHTRVENTRDRP
jgi:hypothetical protein